MLWTWTVCHFQVDALICQLIFKLEAKKRANSHIPCSLPTLMAEGGDCGSPGPRVRTVWSGSLAGLKQRWHMTETQAFAVVMFLSSCSPWTTSRGSSAEKEVDAEETEQKWPLKLFILNSNTSWRSLTFLPLGSLRHPLPMYYMLRRTVGFKLAQADFILIQRVVTNAFPTL